MQQSYITISNDSFREATFTKLSLKIVALEKQFEALKMKHQTEEMALVIKSVKLFKKLRLLFTYKNAVINITLSDLIDLNKLLE